MTDALLDMLQGLVGLGSVSEHLAHHLGCLLAIVKVRRCMHQESKFGMLLLASQIPGKPLGSWLCCSFWLLWCWDSPRGYEGCLLMLKPGFDRSGWLLISAMLSLLHLYIDPMRLSA